MPTKTLSGARSRGITHRIRGLRRLRDCIDSTPTYLVSRRKWILRKFFERWFMVPCVITHKSGARFCLGRDPIADQILCDLNGVYEPLFFPSELGDVPPGELILDIGAHHGGYAVTALFRFPGARMICVEPDPVAALTIRRHLKINGLGDRVEVHECGIGKNEADGLLEQSIEGSWGNRVVAGDSESPVVPIRLRQLSSVLNGRNPYVVKCNCEGGEFYAIPQLLALGCRPKLIILLVHPKEGNAAALLESVRDAGYIIKPVQTSISHPRYLCWLVDARD